MESSLDLILSPHRSSPNQTPESHEKPFQSIPQNPRRHCDDSVCPRRLRHLERLCRRHLGSRGELVRIARPGTGDTATFDNAGGAVDVIDLGAGVTIGGITFDNAAVAAYTIGSGTVGSQALTLNNSGAITASSTINANQLVNAALVLGIDASERIL